MKKPLTRLIFQIAVFLIGGATAALANDAKPFVPRDGIPNTASKLQAGEPVTVVFLGGSITENGGGFTRLVPQWLRKTYPGSDIRAVNAGMSGTPSHFGAQRMDRDVLSANPDLIFVEFAVNDGNGDATTHMERIVRKAWQKNPETDVVFIYTLNANTHLEDYARGKLPPAAASHERVAGHYGIPSIGMAYEAARKIRSGELTIEEFAPDKIHPAPGGYAVYTKAVTTALQQMIESQKKLSATPHSLPEPLTKNLVLYPESPKAQPLPQAEPLIAADGRRSVQTFAAPVPGRHWIGDTVYTVDGQPRWEMKTMVYDLQQKPEPSVGLDPSQWKSTSWFAEGNYFTGAIGTLLYGLDNRNVTQFATSTRDLPVLVFTAPSSGDYCFEVSSETMKYFGPPSRTACFNIVQSGSDGATGISIASETLVKQDNKSLNLSGTTHLQAGETLAFMISKDSTSRVYFPDFKLTIGLLPENH